MANKKIQKRFFLPRKIINLLFGEDKNLSQMKIGLLASKTPEVDQDSLIDNIGKYIESHDLNVFVGPEFLFTKKDKLYTKEEKDVILEHLAKLTEGRNILLVPGTIMWEDDKYFYNTAPVIANGKVLGEYHKQTDGETIGIARKRGSKKKYFTGTQSGVYNWGKLKVGVEVCKDYGRLKQNKPESDLDLYIIPSAGFTYGPIGKVTPGDIKASPPVRKGGYVFNADGYYGTSVVSPKYPDKVLPTNRDRELDIYNIEQVSNTPQ